MLSIKICASESQKTIYFDAEHNTFSRENTPCPDGAGHLLIQVEEGVTGVVLIQLMGQSETDGYTFPTDPNIYAIKLELSDDSDLDCLRVEPNSEKSGSVCLRCSGDNKEWGSDVKEKFSYTMTTCKDGTCTTSPDPIITVKRIGTESDISKKAELSAV